MVQVPIQKRPNDLFVSYGHADKTIVDPIVDWLRRSAGLKIWYDATSGDGSKRTTTLLANAIQSARVWLDGKVRVVSAIRSTIARDYD